MEDFLEDLRVTTSENAENSICCFSILQSWDGGFDSLTKAKPILQFSEKIVAL